MNPRQASSDFRPSRRGFIQRSGGWLAAAGLGLPQFSRAAEGKVIPGFEKLPEDPHASKDWVPISDRKIRVGLVGHGLCKFAAAFGFQDHPNVEVVAVSDLFPDRCAELARATRCAKTYPSLEELVKDDRIEAVFVATDAPSHARHCIEVLKHGKHVACAVPAVYASLEEAEQLWEAVRKSDRTYVLFETSAFHEDLHAMRRIYRTGGLGKLVYAEGEYFHYMDQPLASNQDGRVGLPPQFYPTHSNAYYHCVTGGSFTEVSCLGMPSVVHHLKPENNRYRNPFGTEIALFRTSEGGSARMAVSWDTPGAGGEMGRVRGQRGSFYGEYEGLEKSLPDPQAPAPPSRGRRQRPRRIPRAPDPRIHHRHPPGSPALGRHRDGPESHQFRHCRPPLGHERRRAAEDPAVQALSSHHRILIRRFVSCESRSGS